MKFSRGWSYVEQEKDFLALEAGSSQVNYSAPILEGEKLIYGSERFGVIALNKFTGQKIWQRSIKDGVSSVPFVYQGKLYIGGDNGSYYCLDLKNGSEIWSVELGMPSSGTPIIVEQKLINATTDEAVHALDLSTGKILWSYKRPTFTNTSIRGGGNPSYIDSSIWIGFSDGSLVALNPEDGSVKVEKQYRDNLKFLDIDARPVAWKEGILVSTYDGKLRYLHRDGSLIWEFNAGGARSPILANTGETIYFPSSDGNIYSILGATAKEKWRQSVLHGVPTGLSYLESKNALIASSSVERIYALDASSGKILAHYDLGRGSGSFSSPLLDKETQSIYILSNYGRIYQLRLENR